MALLLIIKLKKKKSVPKVDRGPLDMNNYIFERVLGVKK